MSEADDLRRLACLLDDAAGLAPCPAPETIFFDVAPREQIHDAVAREILRRWDELCAAAIAAQTAEISELRARLAGLFATSPSSPLVEDPAVAAPPFPPADPEVLFVEPSSSILPFARTPDPHDPFERGRKARREEKPGLPPGGLPKADWDTWINGWKHEDELIFARAAP